MAFMANIVFMAGMISAAGMASAVEEVSVAVEDSAAASVPTTVVPVDDEDSDDWGATWKGT